MAARNTTSLLANAAFALRKSRHMAGLRQPIAAFATVTTGVSKEGLAPLDRPHFQLKAAAVLERSEVITKDLTPFELKYKEFVDMINLEKSKLTIEEVEAQASNQKEADHDGEKGQNDYQINQALEWEQVQEKDDFVPASRITEADKANNRHSTERRLQDVLYLLVRERGESGAWRFPTANHSEKENLRLTATRALNEAANAERHALVSFTSNRPMAVGTFPVDDTANDCAGSKTFFFHAYWLKGPLSLDEAYQDYAWVAADELQEYVNVDYFATVNEILRR